MPFTPVETAPVSSFYGEPADIRSQSMELHGREVRLAPRFDSVVPFEEPPERHPRKCVAEDNTCNGWKAKGTELCIGHLRAKGL